MSSGTLTPSAKLHRLATATIENMLAIKSIETGPSLGTKSAFALRDFVGEKCSIALGEFWQGKKIDMER